VSEELQLLGGTDTFNWVVGAYAGYETGNESNRAVILTLLNPLNPFRFFDRIRNSNEALFGQANWRFLPDWRLTGGLRYSADQREIDAFNTNATGCIVPSPGYELTGRPGKPGNGPSDCGRTFTTASAAPSWLVSVDYQVLPTTMLYAKISHGYRAGGINFRGANTVESFSSFAPETVTEYEGGVKSQWFGNRVRLDLAGFHDEYKDIQRSITVATPSGNPATVVTNAASATINGMELEAMVRVTPEITFEGNAGMTDAFYNKFIDITGDHTNVTFGIPKWVTGVTARYTRPLSVGVFSAQIDYHFQSDLILEPLAPTPGQTAQGAYGLLNSRVSLALADQNVDLVLWGKNLTGREYNVSSVSVEEGLGYNYVMAGEPRTFGVAVVKHFGAD
jgi:iron complex outermembrane receptor protein